MHRGTALFVFVLTTLQENDSPLPGAVLAPCACLCVCLPVEWKSKKVKQQHGSQPDAISNSHSSVGYSVDMDPEMAGRPQTSGPPSHSTVQASCLSFGVTKYENTRHQTFNDFFQITVLSVQVSAFYAAETTKDNACLLSIVTFPIFMVHLTPLSYTLNDPLLFLVLYGPCSPTYTYFICFCIYLFFIHLPNLER